MSLGSRNRTHKAMLYCKWCKVSVLLDTVKYPNDPQNNRKELNF